jgi:hypothetical protein
MFDAEASWAPPTVGSPRATKQRYRPKRKWHVINISVSRHFSSNGSWKNICSVSSASKPCSFYVVYPGAAFTKVISRPPVATVNTNAPKAITLRGQWGREWPLALTNDIYRGVFVNHEQTQPYSSTRPQQESNVPTTIRKSTNLVEHVLYVLPGYYQRQKWMFIS